MTIRDETFFSVSQHAICKLGSHIIKLDFCMSMLCLDGNGNGDIFSVYARTAKEI
jgi:hypothetical protein